MYLLLDGLVGVGKELAALGKNTLRLNRKKWVMNFCVFWLNFKFT
jgi:hypothetical protein